jgi:hypothetical protein
MYVDLCWRIKEYFDMKKGVRITQMNKALLKAKKRRI